MMSHLGRVVENIATNVGKICIWCSPFGAVINSAFSLLFTSIYLSSIACYIATHEDKVHA